MMKVKEMTFEEFFNMGDNIIHLSLEEVEEEQEDYTKEAERSVRFYKQMLEYCKDELNVFFIEDMDLIKKIIDFSKALDFCTSEQLPTEFMELLFKDDIERIKGGK